MSIERKKERSSWEQNEVDGSLALFWHLSGHQSIAEPFSDHKSVACVDLNHFSKFDRKLVYLSGIHIHWYNHMLIKGTVKSPVQGSGMVPPVDTLSNQRLCCHSDLLHWKWFYPFLLHSRGGTITNFILDYTTCLFYITRTTWQHKCLKSDWKIHINEQP